MSCDHCFCPCHRENPLPSGDNEEAEEILESANQPEEDGASSQESDPDVIVEDVVRNK